MKKKKIIHMPRWLGDVLMAWPFVRAAVRSEPNVHWIGVIEEHWLSLVQEQDLGLDWWPIGKAKRDILQQKLNEESEIEEVIFLTHSIGSIWPYWRAGIPKRKGFRKGLNRFFLNESYVEKAPLVQTESLFELLPKNLEIDRSPLYESESSETEEITLLIFPGAKYGEAKRWNVESYAEVAKTARSKGWKVVLCGAKDEVDLCREIYSLLGGEAIDNKSGEFSMSELMAFMKNCSRPLALCNDSGAMHLSAALGLPTLALYFSTSPDKTPPAMGNYLLRSSEIDCRPCFKRTCPYGHFNCRTKIKPEEVVESLERLLEKA